MKFSALVLLSAIQLVAVNGEKLNLRHVAKRQGPSGSTTVASSVAPHSSSAAPAPSPPAPSSSASSSAVVHPPSSSTSAPGATTTTPASSVSSASSSTVASSASSAAFTLTGPPPLATYTGVPPLANITLGMATRNPLPAATTYTAGAKPPVSGAPVLPSPSATAYALSSWPMQDRIPPTDSPEVQEWLKELDGWNIPNLSTTVNGSCALSPAQAADAANRGWWTCGGHTRDTDIVACPNKYDWGVSFDDGPSGYSMWSYNYTFGADPNFVYLIPSAQYLLSYLQQKDINATFFVVGSRVIERPQLVVEEYMSGHEISVHTWSHTALTTLTNEQIVAELGWTRKAINTFIGVTPTTMRPPYGDIDDRVRAISLAMGMVPIMWTRSPTGDEFDTNDWRVASGMVGGTDSFNSFQQILGNATLIDTGFIVLQHDLFEITVDLAVGYTLDAAQSHNPKFNLKSIGECQNFPPGDLYLESNTNKTFPFTNSSSGGVDVTGDGTTETKSGDGGATSPTKNAAFLNTIPLVSSAAVVGLGLMGLLL